MKKTLTELIVQLIDKRIKKYLNDNKKNGTNNKTNKGNARRISKN